MLEKRGYFEMSNQSNAPSQPQKQWQWSEDDFKKFYDAVELYKDH